jgi:hypothetical protein
MTHACPGCSKPVRPAMYACGGCWRRLPVEHRTPILRAWGRRQRGVEGAIAEHEDAKASAAAWFEEHPR